MTSKLLCEFYQRDLDKVKEELSLFPDEASVWKLAPGINNSTGTLCLHIAGNLLHFIGATLGHTGYIRDRDKEFSLRNISRNDLTLQLNQAKAVLEKTLPGLTDAELQKDFPLEKHGQVVSTHHMLLHLLIHLGYHLGQINYHRRLVAK